MGDDDIMDLPPRSKKANIMTRDCMWWINMPHQLGICAMVIGVTMLSMYLHTGRVHQTQIEGLCEYMTEGSWAAWKESDCVEPNSCPYYCMCRRWDGNSWETLESGTKPYAIKVNGNWISHDQTQDNETFYFKGGSVTNVVRRTGWTFED